MLCHSYLTIIAWSAGQAAKIAHAAEKTSYAELALCYHSLTVASTQNNSFKLALASLCYTVGFHIVLFLGFKPKKPVENTCSLSGATD